MDFHRLFLPQLEGQPKGGSVMNIKQRQHWEHQYRTAQRKGYHQHAQELAERLGLNLRRSLV
jgi:hypothetical protein